MKFLFDCSIFVLLIVNVNGSVLNCMQAWNGGGTGAWYRVDTKCNYSFLSTRLIYCLPTIILPSNVTKIRDGFYISLGIYNRFNGISGDIGLTYDTSKTEWVSYFNDDKGWKSGNISINSSINRCINVTLSIVNDSINYIVRTKVGSIILGEDIYLLSSIDPLFNLTNNNIGFYRFDSIAQTKETLKSGSQMISAEMIDWSFELNSRLIVPANEYYISLNVHGYSPGPCCTINETNTITVYQQTKWNQSNISISYL